MKNGPQNEPPLGAPQTALSLDALHAAHPGGPLLLIDSASSRIQVALLRPGAPALWETSGDEAGAAIFACAEKLLARASASDVPAPGASHTPLPLDAIAAFIFCDGPGSVLGIRTAAVAIRTWRVLRERPVYSYCSLALAAHHLTLTENARNLALIADARRDTWHHVAIDADGRISELHRIPAAQLSATATLAMPGHFRHWTPLPPAVRIVPYSLADQLPALATVPLFAPAPEPDAFLHEEPVYQTWTPKIHQR